MDYIELKKLVHNFESLAKKKPKLYYIDESKINDKGVFAQNSIKKGTLIGVAITAGAKDRTSLGKYINHQFKCNSKLVEKKDKSCEIVAIKNIAKNEEITANYKKTPDYIDKNTEEFIEL